MSIWIAAESGGIARFDLDREHFDILDTVDPDNGQALNAGDAVTLDGETRLALARGQDAEVLVFDLAR